MQGINQHKIVRVNGTVQVDNDNTLEVEIQNPVVDVSDSANELLLTNIDDTIQETFKIDTDPVDRLLPIAGNNSNNVQSINTDGSGRLQVDIANQTAAVINVNVSSQTDPVQVESNNVQVASEATQVDLYGKTNDIQQKVVGSVLESGNAIVSAQVIAGNNGGNADYVNTDGSGNLQVALTGINALATEVTVSDFKDQNMPWNEIALGNDPNREPHNIYLYAEDIGATERVFVSDSDASIPALTYPTSPTASSIASRDGAFVEPIIVKYYTDVTDEDYVTEVVMLNGNTPVALAQPFYRLYSLTSAPTNSTVSSDHIYVGPTAAVWVLGLPSIVYGILPKDLTQSYSPVIWVPANKQRVISDLRMGTDSNDTGNVFQITLKEFPNGATLSYNRAYFINQHTLEFSRIFGVTPPQTTVVITVQRVSGSGTHRLNMFLDAWDE